MNDDFKKLMAIFKTGKLTPKQMGKITRQYFTKTYPRKVYDYEEALKILGGKLV